MSESRWVGFNSKMVMVGYWEVSTTFRCDCGETVSIVMFNSGYARRCDKCKKLYRILPAVNIEMLLESVE